MFNDTHEFKLHDGQFALRTVAFQKSGFVRPETIRAESGVGNVRYALPLGPGGQTNLRDRMTAGTGQVIVGRVDHLAAIERALPSAQVGLFPCTNGDVQVPGQQSFDGRCGNEMSMSEFLVVMMSLFQVLLLR